MNKYYSDSGLDYTRTALGEIFSRRNAGLCELDCKTVFPFSGKTDGIDFVLFFDKDINLARHLEGRGLRLINRASTIEICDDKIRTYSALSRLGLNMPKTVCAPLMFDVCDNTDNGFLDYVGAELLYPVVVKENVGSQGKQVYLAKNRSELNVLYERLKKIPHHYQQFIDGAYGEDTRIYIVGKKAVAAARRQNTTDFRSNICMGGSIKVVEAGERFTVLAEAIARELNLEYGSVDFIESGIEGAAPVFIEANSNAYFRAIENAGVKISEMLADYVLSQFSKL